jgi:hypothetical protein
MRVELLLVDECPHADAARTLLSQGLANLGLDLTMVEERVGDYPSPTVLVDGVDVMTGATGIPRVNACRLDVPTRAAVTAALHAAASAGPGPRDSDWYPPQLAVGVTSERIALVSPGARRLHEVILDGFATAGHAPGPVALAAAVPPGADADRLLAELHDRDVIRLDERGIRSAYPFSGVATRHQVAIDGGPIVYAMCAIDALGVHAMLGRDTVITSADPTSGAKITVVVQDGRALWTPDTAVVVVGSATNAPMSGTASCLPAAPTEAQPVAAADRCCTVMNFFTDTASAEEWLVVHPEVTGVILTHRQALHLGVDIFGRLLDRDP